MLEGSDNLGASIDIYMWKGFVVCFKFSLFTYYEWITFPSQKCQIQTLLIRMIYFCFYNYFHIFFLSLSVVNLLVVLLLPNFYCETVLWFPLPNIYECSEWWPQYGGVQYGPVKRWSGNPAGDQDHQQSLCAGFHVILRCFLRCAKTSPKGNGDILQNCVMLQCGGPPTSRSIRR